MNTFFGYKPSYVLARVQEHKLLISKHKTLEDKHSRLQTEFLLPLTSLHYLP